MSSARTRTSTPPSAHPTRQQLDELDALLQRMLALPVHQGEEGARDEGPAVRKDEVAPDHLAVSSPLPPRPTPHAPHPPSEEPARPARREPPGETVAEHPIERRRKPGSYPPSYMVVETALPVPEREEEETAGLGPRIIPEPGEVDALSGFLEEEDQEERTDDWVPLRSSWQPSAQTWKPLAETWAQRRGPEADEDEPPTARPSPPAPAERPRSGPAPRSTPRLAPATPSAPRVAVPGEQPPIAQPVLSASAPGSPVPVAPPFVAAPVAALSAPVPEIPAPPLAHPVIPPEPIPHTSAQVAAASRAAADPVGPRSADLPPAAEDPAGLGSAERRPAPTDAPPVIPAGSLESASGAPAEEESAAMIPGDPWYLLPLVWFNLVFDALLRLGGVPGQWFCGRAGRAVLATVGLLCLIAAVGWVVADGVEWTWLP